MPETLSVDACAGRLEPSDTLGIPLGTGQPPGLLAALGERDDWVELRVYGALLSVGRRSATRRNSRSASSSIAAL